MSKPVCLTALSLLVLGWSQAGASSRVVEPPASEISPEQEIIPAAFAPGDPVVALSPRGEATVFWQQQPAPLEPGQQPGTNTIICLQNLDREAQPTTPPLIANTTGGDNGQPTGTRGSDGRSRSFWFSQQRSLLTIRDGRTVAKALRGNSLLGRSFDADGIAISSEFVVATGLPAKSGSPNAATDYNGRTFLVWEEGGAIRAGVLGEQGGFFRSPFSVSNQSSGGFKPRVAVSPIGEAVIVWRQTAGAQRGILARRLDSSGRLDGPPFVVRGIVNAKAPDVAMRADGDFVVTWDENGVGGRDVFVQRYASDGSAKEDRQPIRRDRAGSQERARVAMNAAGDYAVVYRSVVQPGELAAKQGGTSILGRRFNDEGETTEEELVIAEEDTESVPGDAELAIDDSDDITVVFERETENGNSQGIFRREVRPLAQPSVCVESDTEMCLGQRFRASAQWQKNNGTAGVGHAERRTADTGTFWFFEQENVELVVKALDTCGIFDAFWIFAAGLTDVQVVLQVEDTATGQTIVYHNPSGAFEPILDTEGFATCDSSPSPALRQLNRQLESTALDAGLDLLAIDPQQMVTQADGECIASPTRLCLARNRFAVDVLFRAADGQSGLGRQGNWTTDTGTFWFFDPANIEVVIKVLDACSVNRRFWVFAGGLTDVLVEITVTDLATGIKRRYSNDQGTPFAPIRDVNAFATCSL